MPQIDFRQAFSAQYHREFPKGESSGTRAARGVNRVPDIAPATGRPLRLSRADWTNIIFVIAAIAGGLFCAFYFFNGAELWRAAAAWPREVLYARPAHTSALRALGLPSAVGATSDEHGDPFSRVNDHLSLDQPITGNPGGVPGTVLGNPGSPGNPGLPGTPGLPDPGSLLSQLGLPAPGGDALMQTFDRAVADLQRASILDTHHTVVVIETPVKQPAKRSVSQLKNASSAGTSATKTAQQTSAQTTRVAGHVTNRVSTPAVTGVGQQTLSPMRGAFGSPGGGLGLGGGGLHAPVSLPGGRR